MSKKYEFTGETKKYFGITLRRIRRISDGLIGGWIEKEDNLSQADKCFVYDHAIVYGNAQILCNSQVYGNARISGNVLVYGNARVYGSAYVSGNIRIFDNACVFGDARVYGIEIISGNASIQSSNDILTFSNVGSENGTLTAYRTSDGSVDLKRGCFRGNVVEFLNAVEEKHGDSRIGKEYRLFVQSIKIRFDIV